MAESIDWNDGAEDTPRRPRSGFWRRFWRSLTGQPTSVETCRPVTVYGDDGEPIHTRVRGAEQMSEQSRQAVGEIVRAATRKHLADLRAEQEARDEDVRAVNRLLRLAEADPALNYGPAATALRARFADRIAALETTPAVVIGAGSPETSALTHCPTCGAPEWLADGRCGWNPVDVECEVCAGTYDDQTRES